MAAKRNESNNTESKTGYTGKYFKYDPSVLEKKPVIEDKKEKNINRGKIKPNKKKKK